MIKKQPVSMIVVAKSLEAVKFCEINGLLKPQ